MTRTLQILTALLLLLPTLLQAAPQCDSIFTSEPSGNQGTVLTPPADMPSLGDLYCNRNGCSGHSSSFSPGDYSFGSGYLGNRSSISTQGATTRLYFDSLTMNNATMNAFGNTENLFIYVRGSLSIAGKNYINGIVYVAGSVTLSGNARIDGALAAGGAMDVGDRVNYDAAAVDNADLGGSCTNAQNPGPGEALALQFGKASSTSVSFDTPFPDGVTPLVFLMPTIDSNAPKTSDGPASVFLGTVSSSGFSWSQQEPPGNTVASRTMAEVHWLAVAPGTYTLPDGSKLKAGSVTTNHALNLAYSDWVDVPLASGLDVVLNQLQSRNNSCWLTSVSQPYSDGIQLNLDTSEAYDYYNGTVYCRPGGNWTLPYDETIGYLALQPGSGSLTLNGEQLNYQFGTGVTHGGGSNDASLSQQCGYHTDLTGFDAVPTLVAGKSSRAGVNGGWLRRCDLSATRVSMVNDEDTYYYSDREHRAENYGFVALEKVQQSLTCISDSFSGSTLGGNWVSSRSSGDFTPSVVDNKLRMTQAEVEQATAVTFQRLFPAADNLITLEFDQYAYGGSGADGMALVLSDAAVTPQPGAFGGPLGYGFKPGIPGFAGGWLGVGIDEYGNFSAEGGGNSIGTRRQAVVVRGSGSGESGYNYLHGSCSDGSSNSGGDCLSPAVDNNYVTPAHRYRLTIDSRVAGHSWVTVERDSGSGFVALVPTFDALAESGQAQVPDQLLLSLTGSTGSETNVHEIDNIEVCAIQSDPVDAQIDHFQFEHTGNGLTCDASSLTLYACANADCSELVSGEVTANLSPATLPGGGWVGGSVARFSGGSTQLKLRKNTAGSVTVGVTGSTPATKPLSQTLCRQGSGPLSSDACTLDFADAGFIFDVPDKLANKPADNIRLKAVKKDDGTQACVAAFAGEDKPLEFWSDYLQPTVRAASQEVTLATGSSGPVPVSNQASLATDITLSFDAQGQASFSVNYPDAGKMQLNARYTGTGEESGLVMTGADQFVSVPVGLCVKAVGIDASCSAGDASCSIYKKAGEEFDLAVQGMAWQAGNTKTSDFCANSTTTPNYAPIGKIKLASELVAPSSGVAGGLGQTEYDHAAAASNLNLVKQSISEVGVFKFTAESPADYLGANLSTEDLGIQNLLAKTANVGRFTPGYLGISPNTPKLAPSCGVFTYLDQPFSFATGAEPKLDIQGYSLKGEVTHNYQVNDWWRYQNAWAERSYQDQSGSASVEAGTVAPGTVELSPADAAAVKNAYLMNARLLYHKIPPLSVTPFSGQLDLVLTAEDLKDADGICYQLQAAGACLGYVFEGIQFDENASQSPDMRHGRLVLDNTYGAETETLLMAGRAEYWNGASWVTNVEDACTSVVPGLTSQLDDADGYNYAPDLLTDQSVTRSDEAASGTAKAAAGEFSLYWRALAAGDAAPYRGQVTAPLPVPDWLKWYWNWDEADANALSDPRASAYFGRYRGHDKIIYWRELH
ncbi:MSHA biogenesis protein MshQ [Shewanella sp. AS16]|uniref:DUF6701 domain-containing protein n=1 Tax=Shewanella sp. AS16 TaxID=2907625 RepID=UPI001F458FF3|nr:DUF6701 domain-containing protein [Shewanella sp. AS16]MCE9685910.1 MSHA biogenesis protein MshQ [Shewanella sp. AS16]